MPTGRGQPIAPTADCRICCVTGHRLTTTPLRAFRGLTRNDRPELLICLKCAQAALPTWARSRRSSALSREKSEGRLGVGPNDIHAEWHVMQSQVGEEGVVGKGVGSNVGFHRLPEQPSDHRGLGS